MKTIIKSLVVGFVCAVIYTGCEPVTEYPVDVAMTDYVLQEGCEWDGLVHDSVYQINSQQELVGHLACLVNKVVPEVDFKKYTLIVVTGVNNSGIKSISAEMRQTTEKSYTLMISIESNAATVIQKWTVAKLVSKMDEKPRIDLEITRDNYLQAEGYIVGYETCGLEIKEGIGIAKGYIFINTNLNDTLTVYNMPSKISFPKEVFPNLSLNQVNAAFPDSFRYTFKVKITYELSSSEEVVKQGYREQCVTTDMYPVLFDYKNSTPVIIKTAIR